MLELNNLLNPVNRSVISAHANPDNLASTLSSLQYAGILTQENFTIVANHANPHHLASALSSLQYAGIFTQENFTIVAKHANPDSLDGALEFLQRARILTQDNFTVVANHANPGVFEVLRFLDRGYTLTQDIFSIVANHANFDELARALSYLAVAENLTHENFNVVATHTNPFYLAKALCYLRSGRILTQENIDALALPAHASLLTDEAMRLVWSRIPRNDLTPENFERLLIAARAENPLPELQRVTAQIIGVADVEARLAQAFNYGQSTHTTSVHRSVSASAQKLMESYWGDFPLETKIQEIKAYVQGLDDLPKHQAAKRCITHLTARDYFFTDSSDVSTRQLLALAYTAILDDTKRQGTLEDAKALFIQALYEIQRGYNLNEQGVDDGQPDRSICAAGTFNKIMEKLNGIHTDVTVYYITHDGASLKFPRLAEVHAARYLKSITPPETETEYQQCKAILDTIQKDNSLACIWDNIKDNVIEELWDEFKEAYGDNPKDRRFLDLINVGCEYLEAPEELPAIKAQLLASDGYQQLTGLQMRDLFNSFQSPLMARLHEHSLWANRHASPDAQKDFDKRFGLVMVPSK